MIRRHVYDTARTLYCCDLFDCTHELFIIVSRVRNYCFRLINWPFRGRVLDTYNDPPRSARHRELIVPRLQCYPQRTITRASNNRFARSGDLFIVRVKNEKIDNNNAQYHRRIGITKFRRQRARVLTRFRI